MLKKMCAGLLVAAVAVMPVTVSAFGLPKVPGVPGAGGGGGGASAADVDAFLAQGEAATALFVKAQIGIVSALKTKEERAKMMSEYEVIKKGIDAKDKKAFDDQKNFSKTLDAELNAKAGDVAAQENLKNLSAEQKVAVAKSMGNLGLAVLMQKKQIETGTALVGGVSSNPMLAAKALALKDAVGTLGNNVKMGGSYLGKLPGLFKTAGISVTLPTDASGKAEDVTFPE